MCRNPREILRASLKAILTLDITAPADIERFYMAKTRHLRDRFFRIPHTAHVDLVVGLNAPEITYPMILEWIKGLSGSNPGIR